MQKYDPKTAHLISFFEARRGFVDGVDTPRDFLERCIETIEEREPDVNAFAAINLAVARKAADASTARYRAGRVLSEIDGMPLGVKDLIETADMPTQLNSPLFKGREAGRDAACVHALRAGGAVIVGKTVTTEFGVGASGPTRNPWDGERTPGGSSSGSAAAIGAAMLPVALGTQVVGSIIRPSGFCGAFAFKPSFGALNQGGIHSPAPSQAHLGAHAGSLQDLWAVCHRIAEVVGGDPGHEGLAGGPDLPSADRPRRLVRLKTSGWEEMDENSRDAFEIFIANLVERDVEILSAEDDPRIAELERELADTMEVTVEICCYEMRWPFGEYRDRAPSDLSERALGYIERAYSMTRADYARALDRRRRHGRCLSELSGAVDGFIMPSAVGPAPIGLAFNGSRGFNAISSGLGAPSLSLPLLVVDALPFGVQLMGFPGTDDRTMAHAVWMMDSFLPTRGN